MWYSCSHDPYDIITIEIKAGLDEMISVIIYSIQQGDHLKVNIVIVIAVTIVTQDRSSLHTAEYDLLQENLHKYSE